MICVADICNPISLLTAAFVILLTLWMNKEKGRKNFPPGPTGMPLVGYVPYLGNNPAQTLMELKKKYGPVMSVEMGRETWVVLNDFTTINESLVKQGEKFSGRPSNFLFDLITEGQGIASVDYGPTWKSLRKFGLTTLRGFGVGKKSMEENVREETVYLLENLEKAGVEEELRKKLSLAVSNIICRIVFGSRFDYEDERFHNLLKYVDGFFSDSAVAKYVGLIAFAPFLRHLPGFRGALSTVLQDYQRFSDILQEIIDDHKKNFVQDDLRDFIDAFLKEMKEKGGDDPSFNEKHLMHYIRDLFEAGTGTTSSTLLWSIFTFCHFPETQEKISEEIRNVIGESGTPTMKHRDQMPYTCAFIHEIMRHKTLAPILFHKTNEPSIINGYDLPKNTIVGPNLWAVHHDPEIFPAPDSFQPERFLDKNGNFVKSKYVIPFSIGPRHCLGEQLASMEIFIFLTSIVQKLEVLPDCNSRLPGYEDSEHTSGVTIECAHFNVIIKKR